MSQSTRWLRRRRLESDGYPERRIDPSILAMSSREYTTLISWLSSAQLQQTVLQPAREPLVDSTRGHACVW